MAANPFAEFAATPAPAVNPFAEFTAPPVQTGIPGPRQAPGFLTQLGRSAASLADVTIGGVLPAVVQQVGYPLARLGRTPQEAQTATARLVSAVESPVGKAFGVTDTPEYQQEAGRQLMDFIGQNFQKGAKWIAEKTGVPQSDVENILGTATVAAPKVVPPVARAVRDAAAPQIEKAVIGAKMPFEPRAQAKRERLSQEDYARGPQIDAAAEAQRLGIVLNPTDIQPTVGPKLTSMVAGPRAPEALAGTNKNQVRKVALGDMDLPATTQLNSRKAFDQARAQVAAPYEEVKKLPIQQADDAMVQRLEALRTDLDVIGAKEYAPAISKIVDDAISKTQTGLTGEQLLKNISVLRERARKTYNNKAATTEALDIADTNLRVATELESMIDNSITNPKLLGQFRDARQKMARTYAYEGATDLNTGMVDVGKLARITAKDNNLTGDIASLGRIAGNFPDVFSAQPTPGFLTAPRLSRSGAGGAAGALIGSQFGLTGSILGGVLGGAAGETASALAARRLASPDYQAGLTLRDARIPVNQLAASMQPQTTAAVTASAAELGQQLNSAQIKIAQLEGELRRTGDAAERQFITAQINRLQQFAGQIEQNLQNAASPQNFTVVPPAAPAAVTPVAPANRMLPAPSAEGTINMLRTEDARRAQMSRTLGQQAEQQAAAAEAAARQPARGGTTFELDPVTGKLVPVDTTLRGATPDIQIIESTGKSLSGAADILSSGKSPALMSAEQRIAWEKTKVDLADVAPGMKTLSDKALATKMMDRVWLQETIDKVKQKAQMQADIAARSQDLRLRQAAMMEREKLQSSLEMLEEQFRKARPVKTGGQGPKTRAFQRNMLTPEQEIQNALAK